MKQLKIAIFCSGGFSTSLIGSKMQKVYDEKGEDVKVDAYDFGMVDEVGDDVDVILLAPQIGSNRCSSSKHQGYPFDYATIWKYGRTSSCRRIKREGNWLKWEKTKEAECKNSKQTLLG